MRASADRVRAVTAVDMMQTEKDKMLAGALHDARAPEPQAEPTRHRPICARLVERLATVGAGVGRIRA